MELRLYKDLTYINERGGDRFEIQSYSIEGFFGKLLNENKSASVAGFISDKVDIEIVEPIWLSSLDGSGLPTFSLGNTRYAIAKGTAVSPISAVASKKTQPWYFGDLRVMAFNPGFAGYTTTTDGVIYIKMVYNDGVGERANMLKVHKLPIAAAEYLNLEGVYRNVFFQEITYDLRGSTFTVDSLLFGFEFVGYKIKIR